MTNNEDKRTERLQARITPTAMANMKEFQEILIQTAASPQHRKLAEQMTQGDVIEMMLETAREHLVFYANRKPPEEVERLSQSYKNDTLKDAIYTFDDRTIEAIHKATDDILSERRLKIKSSGVRP